MTPTFRVVGDQLQEQPRMKFGRADHWNTESEREHLAVEEAYENYRASLRVYTIRPSDWEGITEVNEGKFGFKKQIRLADGWHDWKDEYYESSNHEGCRLVAIPIRPAGKGQKEMVTLSRKQLEDALREVWNDCYNTNGDLSAMDDHIKEAINTITLNKQ